MKLIVGVVALALVAGGAWYFFSGRFNDDIREAGADALEVEGETDCDRATRALELARTNTGWVEDPQGPLQMIVAQYCG